MKKKDNRLFLSKEEAKQCLVEGKTIHTFVNPGGMLVGADRSKKSILELIDNAGEDDIEIGGHMCRNMEHGLVIYEKDGNPVFINAQEAVLKKFDDLTNNHTN